jgi:prolyl 4-hydroxylase
MKTERIAQADRLLVGSAEAAPEPEQALARYREALEGGESAAAGRLAVLAALGVCQSADWNAALDLLAQGAELGDRSCRRQLAALGDKGDRYAEGAVNTPGAWRRVRDELDLDALLTPPPLRPLSRDPLVASAQGFVPPHLTTWLIKRATGRLTRGEVNDFQSGEVRADPMRTATVAPFTVLERDLIVVLIQERAVRLTQVPLTCHEPPNVISYEPGQQYEPHFDFVDPRVPQFRDELAILGQRVYTLVTYLNDDFVGAETFFPRIGVRYRGRPGDVILFQNVHADGRPDERTLHAGLPPERGRKWVLSQWLRDRPQPIL